MRGVGFPAGLERQDHKTPVVRKLMQARLEYSKIPCCLPITTRMAQLWLDLPIEASCREWIPSELHGEQTGGLSSNAKITAFGVGCGGSEWSSPRNLRCSLMPSNDIIMLGNQVASNMIKINSNQEGLDSHDHWYSRPVAWFDVMD